MPGQFSVFAVDLDEVRAVIGSKRRSLLPAIKKRFDSWFENANEQIADSDGGPTLEEVLKLMIAGKPIDPDWSFQFAIAVELLYRHLGIDLQTMQFQTMRIEWASTVDRAIERAGIPEERFRLIRHLFERGPAIPFDTEFLMGYLTLAEVRSAAEAFAGGDYAGLEPEVRIAVAEVRAWLVMCETLGRDLASFYSDAC